jgi:outer membrane protein OmpA-like peptidoglycan-associated protein
MKGVSRKLFTILFTFCIPVASTAQLVPKSLEGGAGVFFTQSPQLSEQGKLGIRFSGLYHSKSPTNLGPNMNLMRVAITGDYALTDHIELYSWVSGFAQDMSKKPSSFRKKDAGLGIGKLGLKFALPAVVSGKISQGIKLGIMTPAGALATDAPNYPVDADAYALETSYLASLPILYNLAGLINVGYSHSDLSGKWDMDNQIIASLALKWRYSKKLNILTDIYTGTLLDAKVDLFQDYLNLAAGVHYSLSPKLGVEFGFVGSIKDLRKSIRAENEANWRLRLGVSFSFDTFIPDVDRDGIDDRRDLDPHTPPGWAVDAMGVPLDSDRDGVADAIDREVLSLPRAEVDAFGIAKDSDSDSVPDGLDVEPNTAANSVVDTRGRRVHGEIYFGFGSMDVQSDSRKYLDQLGEYLEDNNGAQLEIIGYADDMEEARLDSDIGISRAKSVRDYLLKHYKITVDRLKSTGYGQYANLTETPVDGSSHQPLNRKVELRIIKTL